MRDSTRPIVANQTQTGFDAIVVCAHFVIGQRTTFEQAEAGDHFDLEAIVVLPLPWVKYQLSRSVS